MPKRGYKAKMINIYDLVNNEPDIKSQMNKYKPPRKKSYLNELSINSIRKKVK